MKEDILIHCPFCGQQHLVKVLKTVYELTGFKQKPANKEKRFCHCQAIIEIDPSMDAIKVFAEIPQNPVRLNQ